MEIGWDISWEKMNTTLEGTVKGQMRLKVVTRGGCERTKGGAWRKWKQQWCTVSYCHTMKIPKISHCTYYLDFNLKFLLFVLDGMRGRITLIYSTERNQLATAKQRNETRWLSLSPTFLTSILRMLSDILKHKKGYEEER